jgi:tetratricopeptide (TPR) repeat protein
MWYPITKPGLFYYLVGSRDKQYFSPRYIDDELKKNAIKHSTSLLFFRDSIDVLSCYIGDENDIGNYLNKFNLNSDYSPFIEFNIDDRENKGKTLIFNNTLEKIRRRSIVSHIDWTGINRIKKTKWLENYWINYKNFSYLLQAYTSKASYFKRLEINGKGLKNLPWHPAILDRQEKILNVIERVLVTKNISANGVLAMMDRKLHNKDYPKPLYGSFWLIKSWAFRMERNLMNALIAGDKALEYSPNSNAVLKNIVQLSLMTRNTKKAIVHLNKAIQLDPNSPDLHYYVGQISLIQGNYEEAITAYKRVLKLNRKHIKAKEMLDKLVQQLGK